MRRTAWTTTRCSPTPVGSRHLPQKGGGDVVSKLKRALAWCWRRKWKALNLGAVLITMAASVFIAIESYK